MRSLWRTWNGDNEHDAVVSLDDAAHGKITQNLPREVQETLSGTDVKSALAHIREGEYVLKYCRNPLKNVARHHQPHQRLLRVNIEHTRWCIQWESPKKKRFRSCIRFSDIIAILPGVSSSFFQTKSEDDRQLGVEIIATTGKLRFRCTVLKSWKLWLKGLVYTYQKSMARDTKSEKAANIAISRLWALADPSHQGSLQQHEVLNLMRCIQVKADVRYTMDLFNKYNLDGSSSLEYQEFETVFRRLLICSEVMSKFDEYAENKGEFLTQKEYAQFLQDSQALSHQHSEEEAARVSSLIHPLLKFEDNSVSDLAFNILLMSDYNSIFDPAKSCLHHDMNRALSDYWVATCHNPCFSNDRSGLKPLDQLTDVLIRGIRCLEFELWDGSDGFPVVYTSNSQEEHLSFGVVLQTIKEYAFVTSEYPIVLALSLQCHPIQITKLAQQLNSTFEESLVRVPEIGTDSDSGITWQLVPETLKERIIICSHKVGLPHHKTDPSLAEDSQIRMTDIMLSAKMQNCWSPGSSPVDSSRKNSRPAGRRSVAEFMARFSPPGLPLAQPEQKAGRERSSSESSAKSVHSSSSTSAATVPRKPPKFKLDRNRNGVSFELQAFSSMTILFQGTFDDVQNFNHRQVATITERKLLPTIRCVSDKLVVHNRTKLTHIHPHNIRVMVSSVSPMPFWTTGCQFVGCVQQAIGGASLLMHTGRFRENGQSGYVLKPKILTQDEMYFSPHDPLIANLTSFGESPKEICIKVLCGRQLPRLSGSELNIMNLFVVVSVQGIPRDCYTHQTRPVPSSGLDPHWSSGTISFDVAMPSLAMLVFEVRHFDHICSEYLAGYALPLKCIRQGLRWVPLEDNRARVIPWAGLLVEVGIRPSKLTSVNFPQRPEDTPLPLESKITQKSLIGRRLSTRRTTPIGKV